MAIKFCRGCRRNRSVKYFHWRSRKKGARVSRCCTCVSKKSRKHYQQNRAAYVRKAQKWNKTQQRKVTTFILNYLKTHPCVDCGEDDPLVLTFDHVRGTKFKSISDLGAGRYTLERVQAEIKKCVVRCANDHLRRTARQFGWLKLSLLSSKG